MSKLCEVCNKVLDKNSFETHLLGKKHIKRAEILETSKKNVERSVYVCQLPPGATEISITNFFTQFGAVKKCTSTPSGAIVYFHDSETANFLINRPISMEGRRVCIKARRIYNNPPPIQPPPNSVKDHAESNFAELRTRLEAQTTLESEISTFLETVQLDEKEVEDSWRSIHSSLLEALIQTFPKCEIYRFGSSITGLCFKESDFDIYVNVCEDEGNDPRLTAILVFNKASKCLRRKSYIFKKMIKIPKAKTPIIKFLHAPTNRNCDISFKNGLGVINSQLIKKLLQLDNRLRPLMMIIKYWAAFNELSGSGKFTNYAIIMMIIFYLQQPKVKILPTIMELQKTCQPIYKWDCQINFDHEAVFPSSNNKSSISELLAGFFTFYADFKFEENLISPVDGIIHPLKSYAEKYPERMGGNPYTLVLDRAICVQDPIALSINVTYGVPKRLLKSFQSLCVVAAEVCTAASKNENKPFLVNLFIAVPTPSDDQDDAEFSKIVITARKSFIDKLKVEIENREDIQNKEKFVENRWWDLAQIFVEEALKRVFKVEIKTGNKREVKQQKVTETSDVHSKDSDKIILDCTTTNYVVVNRKSNSSSIDPALSPIDKETMISDELIEKQQKSGTVATKIGFTCIVTRENVPLRLILRLQLRNSVKKRIRPFVFFLKTKLPSIVDKQLVHILQYNKLANYP